MGNKLRLYCFLFVCINLSSNAQEFTNNETLRTTLLRVSGIDSMFTKPIKQDPAQHPHLKSETFYKLDSICNYFMDSETDSTLRDKTIFKYDRYGNLIEEAGYYFSILDKKWGFTQRFRYAYDERGNQTLYENYIGDYVQWYGINRIEKTYNEANLVTTETYSYGDEINPEFVLTYYSTIEYNKQNLLKDWIIREWDKNTNQWVNWFRYEYKYNASFDIGEYVSSEWDTINQRWKNIDHITFVKDQTGSTILRFVERYNDEESRWMAYSKETLTYDSLARKTHQLLQHYEPISNKWINTRQENILFSGAQNYEHIWEVWNVLENIWQSNQKIVASFDEYGNEVLYEKYKKKLSDSDWNGVYKYSRKYNLLNEIELLNEYDWSDLDSNWIPLSEFRYSYNKNDNITYIDSYNWNSDVGEWINQAKGTWIYDSLMRTLQHITLIWDTKENQWSLPRKEYYFYSYYTDTYSSNFIKIISFDVYPNPVEDILFVPDLKLNNYEFHIIDATGKLVQTSKPLANQLNVSQFKQGFYLLKIRTYNKLYISRFIKK